MSSRLIRVSQFREYVDRLYQIELQNLQNQIIQNSYYAGQNHNYNYYLSLLTHLQKNEKKWKIRHYRKYLSAYRIQLFWRMKKSKSTKP